MRHLSRMSLGLVPSMLANASSSSFSDADRPVDYFGEQVSRSLSGGLPRLTFYPAPSRGLQLLRKRTDVLWHYRRRIQGRHLPRCRLLPAIATHGKRQVPSPNNWSGRPIDSTAYQGKPNHLTVLDSDLPIPSRVENEQVVSDSVKWSETPCSPTVLHSSCKIVL
jgi:hypothetical protein